MSNPARPPSEPTAVQLALLVAPDAYLPEGYAEFARLHKSVEAIQRALSPLDMDLAPTFFVPKTETVSSAVLNAKGPVMASAKSGLPAPRKRSSQAKQLINKAYSALSLRDREIVGATMKEKVFVDGGTENTLGRLLAAYPRSGGRGRLRPITRAEAREAVASAGLTPDLPDVAFRPFPLIPKEGDDRGITINPNSDNGFPVLGKWTTDGAAAMCMANASAVEKAINEAVRTPEGVWAWLRLQEETRPHFVALMGKAKADYYSVEKVVSGKMRFYNVFPRHMLLNMQKATQVIEQIAENILVDPKRLHSGIGLALNRGGAEQLVKALEAQLAHTRTAFVHVGDDSWVVIEVGTYTIAFALDCSNFDLTQHSAVTAEVHLAIRDVLARVDVAAADLWYAYMRERLVVTAKTLVRRWKHGGPSGAPLQSKVNDVLMDVMIRRLLRELTPKLTPFSGPKVWEDVIGGKIKEVGELMGFSVRMEQFYCVNGKLRSLLYDHPFLFIGYYFHVRSNYSVNNGNFVVVQADVPRTFAQVPYPTLKWEATREDLDVTEAMRLASIAMNLGIPTWECADALESFRQSALELLREVLMKRGNRTDSRLRWAVQANPYTGVEPESSLLGIQRALTFMGEAFWTQPKEAEVAKSVELSTWADEVEAEEEEFPRPQGVRVAPASLPRVEKPTHPATTANDGRPPPTVVWHAPRPPRAPREATSAPVRSRRYRRYAVSEDSDVFYSMSSDSE